MANVAPSLCLGMRVGTSGYASERTRLETDSKHPTVLIVDDHPMVVDALAQLVESAGGFHVVALCSDGDAALGAIHEHTPDLAIIDAHLPRRDGPAIAAAVQRAGLATRMLFVTGHEEPETVSRCAAAGAHAWISMSQPPDRILAAIEAVSAGRTAPAANVDTIVAARRDFPARRDVLSARERRVLELAANGRSTAAIAQELYIAQTTVKTHLRHAASKLGVRGKTAASAAALRQGLIR